MFRSFAEQQPDFAEEFLYAENTGFFSNFLSSGVVPNGFCADFSPSERQKKVNWRTSGWKDEKEPVRENTKFTHVTSFLLLLNFLAY